MFIQINDTSAEFGDLVSVELFGQLADNINHLIDAMPIATILPILDDFPGVPAVDPNIWQECDGSEITHPLSPLRNHSTPDYKTEGRFIRCYNTVGEIGNLSGANDRNLEHSHNSETGPNPDMQDNADTDDDFWTGKVHVHDIYPDLGVFDFRPVNVVIKYYIKINDTNSLVAGKYRDLEKDFATSIAQALWTKSADNINSLDKSYPVGMLLFMFNSQDQLPATPSSMFWQLCDGSTVTNVNSPLLGQVLPDLRDKFIKHPDETDTLFSITGQNSVDLSHNHGGSTAPESDRNDFQLDNGGEVGEAGTHTHTINSDMGTYDIRPSYVELQIYIRIV